MKAPADIQDFLDSIAYNPLYECRSPGWVLRRRKAHCFEGAIFAAAVLRKIGFAPLLVDMKAHNDDDHVIAVYKVKGCWGAVAKSNFTLLRSREPVYKSLRELVMSYFDFFYNIDGEKTLRSYSIPLDLSVFDSLDWETTDADLEYIGDKIESIRHYEILDNEMISGLSPVSEAVMKSGLIGSDPDGLYQPVQDK